jgi:hypothetical protein
MPVTIQDVPWTMMNKKREPQKHTTVFIRISSTLPGFLVLAVQFAKNLLN